MMSFEQTLRAINEMKDEGVIEEYAIAGGMALAFWVEAIPTYDLDVMVAMPQSASPLISLDAIYRWASAHGFVSDREHIVISGVPVQFLPAHSDLAAEALSQAEKIEYGSIAARVVRPEYLVALYLEGSARTQQRRERAVMLRDSGQIDLTLLQDVMQRFKLMF
jgi:hypothetical protein